MVKQGQPQKPKSYLVVWSCCRWNVNVPRTWRLVEPGQVPPLSVAGLSATARIIEPLQHRTCSHLDPTAATGAKINVKTTDLTLTGRLRHRACHACKDVASCACFLQKWSQNQFMWVFKNLNEYMFFSLQQPEFTIKNQCIKEYYGHHKDLFGPVIYFIISALWCTGGLC